MNVTLSQALLGPDGGGAITKEVNQLDGRRVEVTLPEGVSFGRPVVGLELTRKQIIQPGQETRVVGEGMPISKANSVKRKGDLIVRWNVVFPTSLPAQAKQELRKVLG